MGWELSQLAMVGLCPPLRFDRERYQQEKKRTAAMRTVTPTAAPLTIAVVLESCASTVTSSLLRSSVSASTFESSSSSS